MDIQDINEDDVDMLSEGVQAHFKNSYKFKGHKSVGLNETYVMQLSASRSGGGLLAGLSNNSFATFDLELNKLRSEQLKEPVIDVKFSAKDKHLFYVGTSQSIQLWDSRLAKDKSCASEFKLGQLEDGRKAKPFSSFDVNKDDCYLSVGTEVVNHDAFLLFWDTRKCDKLLGGYWETFGDDVTVTKFDPNLSNQLVSSSSDGQVIISLLIE